MHSAAVVIIISCKPLNFARYTEHYGSYMPSSPLVLGGTTVGSDHRRQEYNYVNTKFSNLLFNNYSSWYDCVIDFSKFYSKTFADFIAYHNNLSLLNH